ncbi:MAG: hypothetical protein HND48_25495 [Chloroflexi bacterium]|nr:hypothetical protein [Chloroflexota bacterium]
MRDQALQQVHDRVEAITGRRSRRSSSRATCRHASEENHLLAAALREPAAHHA